MAERARRAPNVCVASVRRLSCALLLFGCDGDFVNLGASERMLNGGDAGAQGGAASRLWSVELAPVVAQEDSLGFANPTLTGDSNELYFTSQVQGDGSAPILKLAKRVGERFGAPASVLFQLGSTKPEELAVASPAVSADGAELWLSLLSDVGNIDVFHCTRAGDKWLEPTLVSELSSPDRDDAPRPPAVDGTLMPLSSKRHGGVLYQIYLAQRPNDQAAWGEPSQDLLGTINLPNVQSADGFLNKDATELYFSSTRDGGKADLYVARRASVTDPFGEPEPLFDLNLLDYNERMPWVSPDGKVIYFASDRPTPAFQEYALYRATRL
jgi:hypothetical protein